MKRIKGDKKKYVVWCRISDFVKTYSEPFGLISCPVFIGRIPKSHMGAKDMFVLKIAATRAGLGELGKIPSITFENAQAVAGTPKNVSHWESLPKKTRRPAPEVWQ